MMFLIRLIIIQNINNKHSQMQEVSRTSPTKRRSDFLSTCQNGTKNARQAVISKPGKKDVERFLLSLTAACAEWKWYGFASNDVTSWHCQNIHSQSHIQRIPTFIISISMPVFLGKIWFSLVSSSISFERKTCVDKWHRYFMVWISFELSNDLKKTTSDLWPHSFFIYHPTPKERGVGLYASPSTVLLVFLQLRPGPLPKRHIIVLLWWQEFATRSVAVFFLTCYRGAGGEYRSVLKLRLLIDIQTATSRWPFLFCCKLGHIVHLSRWICCLAFMGMRYAPCIAGQSVLFHSPHASSQHTHQPLPPLLTSGLIALVVLGTELCYHYSSIVWSCEHSVRSDSTQFNSNGSQLDNQSSKAYKTS